MTKKGLLVVLLLVLVELLAMSGSWPAVIVSFVFGTIAAVFILFASIVAVATCIMQATKHT